MRKETRENLDRDSLRIALNLAVNRVRDAESIILGLVNRDPEVVDKLSTYLTVNHLAVAQNKASKTELNNLK